MGGGVFVGTLVLRRNKHAKRVAWCAVSSVTCAYPSTISHRSNAPCRRSVLRWRLSARLPLELEAHGPPVQSSERLPLPSLLSLPLPHPLLEAFDAFDPATRKST